jgi:hypothetical protein
MASERDTLHVSMSGSPSSSASDYRSTWSSASWSGGGCCWEPYDNGVRKAITSDPDGTRLRIAATLSGRLEEAVEVIDEQGHHGVSRVLRLELDVQMALLCLASSHARCHWLERQDGTWQVAHRDTSEQVEGHLSS